MSYEKQPSMGRNAFVKGLIAGILIGMVALSYYKNTINPPAPLSSYDRNEDGKADTWYEYEGNLLVKEYYDNNHNGKADAWYYYEKAVLSKIEIDGNHDGAVDNQGYYDESGDTAEAEYDRNFDGEMDYWEYFENASQVSYESDNDFNGTHDEWGIVEDGQIVEANWSYHNDKVADKVARYRYGRKYEESYDRDRDGIFDEVIQFDEYERAIVR